LRIRSAIPADVPAIMALERSAPTSAHYSGEQYRQIVEQGERFIVGGLLPELDLGSSAEFPIPEEPGIFDDLSRVVLVGEEHSRVKGFLIGRALGTEWEIENLVIAADARKRGFGRELVGQLLVLAQNHGACKVFLEVRESNTAARRLYEKSQFVESGRRRNYHRDPVEDAILYTRDLPDCT